MAGMDIILWLLGAAFAAGLGAVAAYALDPYNRASLMRSFAKKNFGVLEVVGKGRRIQPFVRDFSGDSAEANGRTYVLDPDRVYVKRGLPTITVNEKDIEPLSLDKVTESVAFACPNCKNPIRVDVPASRHRDPALVNQLLMKAKQVAETKVLFTDQMLHYAIYGACLLAFIAAILAFTNSGGIGEVQTMTKAMANGGVKCVALATPTPTPLPAYGSIMPVMPPIG